MIARRLRSGLWPQHADYADELILVLNSFFYFFVPKNHYEKFIKIYSWTGIADASGSK